MPQTIKNKTIPGPHGRKLLYDVHYKETGKEKPVVVFVHGFKGFKDWGTFNIVAEEFANKGYVFIKFNFSFNGGAVEQPIDFPDLEAFGMNNYSKELDDLNTLISAIKNEKLNAPYKEMDTSNINLLGHSRGGSIAVIGSVENEVNKLVTWSAVANFYERIPADDIEKWKDDGVIYISNARTGQNMPIYYQFYEDLMNNKLRLDILSKAKQLNIPWLIIHGENDETVPNEDAKRLESAGKNTSLYTIPETGHTFD
ncbi:MAG: alpha/beta hydrolase family protein, partial [Flavobacteriales bacterium]